MSIEKELNFGNITPKNIVNSNREKNKCGWRT